MALTVENGSGVADADTYVGLDDFKAYVEDFHGELLNGFTNAQMERALRRASQYVDVAFEFVGERLLASQAMEFPRSSLTTPTGEDVTGVPTRLKRAVADLARKALVEDLTPDLDKASRIKSESVGPVSITYADDAPQRKLYDLAARLLAPYILSNDRRNAPRPGFTAPVAAAAISLGMDSFD